MTIRRTGYRLALPTNKSVGLASLGQHKAARLNSNSLATNKFYPNG